MKKMTFRATVVALACFLLISCDEVEDIANYVPPPPPEAVVADGRAYDGLLIGSTISAYRLNEEKMILGEPIAQATTDNEGYYAIQIPGETEDGLIALVATGGYYVEEAGETKVTLSDDDNLVAYASYTAGKPITTLITPLTHYSAALADYIVLKQGYNAENALIQATQAIAGHFGVDIYSTKPYNLLTESDQVTELNDRAKYALIFAGISQYMSDIRLDGDNTSVLNSIYFHKRLAEDIRFDGAFNGFGHNGDIYIGDEQIDVDLLRNVLPMSIIAYIESESNKTHITAKMIIDYGRQLSANTGKIFDYLPSTPFDNVSPEIEILMPYQVYAGVFDFCVVITDNLVLNSARMKVNSLSIDSVLLVDKDTGEACIEINSLTTVEEELSAVITAEDAFGNTAEKEYVIKVSNTKPFFNINNLIIKDERSYPTAYVGPNQDFELTGSVGVGQHTTLDTLMLYRAGVQDYRTSRNYQPVAHTRGQQSTYAISELISFGKDPIEAGEGINHYTLVACDLLGNCTPYEIVIIGDREIPGMFSDRLPAQFSEYDSLTDSVAVVYREAAMLVISPEAMMFTPTIAITDNKSSLDGLQNEISVLDANGIFYFEITFGDEVQEGQGRLDSMGIEYSYSYINSSGEAIEVIEFSDLKNSPIISIDEGSYSETITIPFVEELLGSDWHKRTSGTEHRITIRLTDASGNVSEESIIFFTHYDIAIEKVLEETIIRPIDTLNFNNRLALAGMMLAPIKYTFKNSTGTLLYVKPKPNVTTSIAVTNNRTRYERITNKIVYSTSGNLHNPSDAIGGISRQYVLCPADYSPCGIHDWGTNLVTTTSIHTRSFTHLDRPNPRRDFTQATSGKLCCTDGYTNSEKNQLLTGYLGTSARTFYYDGGSGYRNDTTNENNSISPVITYLIVDQFGNQVNIGKNGIPVQVGQKINITIQYSIPPFTYHNDSETEYHPTGERLGTFLKNTSINLDLSGSVSFDVLHPDIDTYQQSNTVAYRKTFD